MFQQTLFPTTASMLLLMLYSVIIPAGWSNMRTLCCTVLLSLLVGLTWEPLNSNTQLTDLVSGTYTVCFVNCKGEGQVSLTV